MRENDWSLIEHQISAKFFLSVVGGGCMVGDAGGDGGGDGGCF